MLPSPCSPWPSHPVIGAASQHLRLTFSPAFAPCCWTCSSDSWNVSKKYTKSDIPIGLNACVILLWSVQARRKISIIISPCSFVHLSNRMRQPTMALSSIEVEYRSVTMAAQESTWLRQLMKDLHQPTDYQVRIFCDNLFASICLALAENLVFYARTKHIEVHYHYIRDKVLEG